MTEQEFFEEIKGYVSFGNLGSVMNAAKAYAASEVEKAVAAKDKEIAELKAENKRLRQFIEGEKTKIHPQSLAAKMYNKILDGTHEPPT